MKFHETQKEKLKGDHDDPINTKKLTQPSEKVGYPVTFAVKKIYSFTAKWFLKKQLQF